MSEVNKDEGDEAPEPVLATVVTILDVVPARGDTPDVGEPSSLMTLGRADGVVEMIIFPLAQTGFLVGKLLENLAHFGDASAERLHEEFLRTHPDDQRDGGADAGTAGADTDRPAEDRSAAIAFVSSLEPTGLAIPLRRRGGYRSHAVLGGYDLPDEPCRYVLLCRDEGPPARDFAIVVTVRTGGCLLVDDADAAHPMVMRAAPDVWRGFGDLEPGQRFRPKRTGSCRKLTREELRALLSGDVL
jgi:hypothetical protein